MHDEMYQDITEAINEVNDMERWAFRERVLAPPPASDPTLDMNGMNWSPAALEKALEILRSEGRVKIIGLPGPYPSPEQNQRHFVLEPSLKEWSALQLYVDTIKPQFEGADLSQIVKTT